jgi:hypothetical protein
VSFAPGSGRARVGQVDEDASHQLVIGKRAVELLVDPLRAGCRGIVREKDGAQLRALGAEARDRREERLLGGAEHRDHRLAQALEDRPGRVTVRRPADAQPERARGIEAGRPSTDDEHIDDELWVAGGAALRAASGGHPGTMGCAVQQPMSRSST